mmetsp:Transcript_111037/g.319080  ORF Transcript_111037/g.319080 Transcript_111037/m.319080 type:complete len:248 (+) Transcript_111037:2714-3457(+)
MGVFAAHLRQGRAHPLGLSRGRGQHRALRNLRRLLPWEQLLEACRQDGRPQFALRLTGGLRAHRVLHRVLGERVHARAGLRRGGHVHGDAPDSHVEGMRCPRRHDPQHGRLRCAREALGRRRLQGIRDGDIEVRRRRADECQGGLRSPGLRRAGRHGHGRPDVRAVLLQARLAMPCGLVSPRRSQHLVRSRGVPWLRAGFRRRRGGLLLRWLPGFASGPSAARPGALGPDARADLLVGARRLHVLPG